MVAALSELPGIAEEDVIVYVERDAFTVRYDAARVGLDEMYEAIIELGYSPGIEPQDETLSQPEAEVTSSPLDAAFELARTEGKLLFVDFSAEWCAACKLLEQTVLNNAEVQEVLLAYVVVQVDMDTYPQEASGYEVVGMPTLLVLNVDGKELFRSVGLIEVNALQRKLHELVGK